MLGLRVKIISNSPMYADFRSVLVQALATCSGPQRLLISKFLVHSQVVSQNTPCREDAASSEKMDGQTVQE